MSSRIFYKEISQYILKWTGFSLIVGFLGACLVYSMEEFVTVLAQIRKVHYLLTPLIGGGIVGLIIYYIDSRAAGLGTNIYISYTKGNTNIHQPIKLFLSKILATQATLGLIGFGGLVGPLLLLGSSLAFFIREILELFRIRLYKEARVVSACGAAATVGSLLKAPLGGGIFASEILYKSALDYNELFPAILSSSFGYFFYKFISPTSQSEIIINFPQFQVADLMLLVVVALICGLLGQFFISLFNWTNNLFSTLPIQNLFKPMLVSCIIILFYTRANLDLKINITEVTELFSDPLPIKLAVTLLLLKILLTIVVISSGGSAAVLNVAILSGAITGNMLYHIFSSIPLPTLMIVGSAATIASIANVPLATIILFTEVFNLNSVLPVVIGGIVGFLIGRPRTVFEYIE